MIYMRDDLTNQSSLYDFMFTRAQRPVQTLRPTPGDLMTKWQVRTNPRPFHGCLKINQTKEEMLQLIIWFKPQQIERQVKTPKETCRLGRMHPRAGMCWRYCQHAKHAPKDDAYMLICSRFNVTTRSPKLSVAQLELGGVLQVQYLVMKQSDSWVSLGDHQSCQNPFCWYSFQRSQQSIQ